MTLDITTDQWLAGAKYRRSIYGLKGASHVSDERIKEIVENVLSFTPSSWNCQHARLTLVLGEKHTQLWDVVQKEAEPVLKGISEDLWKLMGPRIQGFRNAYGSILFWNSEDSIREAKIDHKNGAHIIPEWSEHAIGMCQILILTALEIEGFGANLTHMNGIPTLDACIKEFAHIPNDYVLKATMHLVRRHNHIRKLFQGNCLTGKHCKFLNKAAATNDAWQSGIVPQLILSSRLIK